MWTFRVKFDTVIMVMEVLPSEPREADAEDQECRQHEAALQEQLILEEQQLRRAQESVAVKERRIAIEERNAREQLAQWRREDGSASPVYPLDLDDYLDELFQKLSHPGYVLAGAGAPSSLTESAPIVFSAGFCCILIF